LDFSNSEQGGLMNSCEYIHETLGSIKAGKFSDQLVSISFSRGIFLRGEIEWSR